MIYILLPTFSQSSRGRTSHRDDSTDRYDQNNDDDDFVIPLDQVYEQSQSSNGNGNDNAAASDYRIKPIKSVRY